MKANEFVKKFGWEYAKHILTDDALLVMDLNYNDLKRLVESHELIEQYNGLFEAKELIRVSPKLTSELRELTVATADVDSCK